VSVVDIQRSTGEELSARFTTECRRLFSGYFPELRLEFAFFPKFDVFFFSAIFICTFDSNVA